MTIELLQNAIADLPGDKYSQLRDWFFERDQGLWDEQIAADSESGKLDFLLDEAKSEPDERSPAQS